MNRIKQLIDKQNTEMRLMQDYGSIICKKLKKIKPDLSWMQISNLLLETKQRARDIIYCKEISQLEILSDIRKYTDDELQELLASKWSPSKSKTKKDSRRDR